MDTKIMNKAMENHQVIRILLTHQTTNMQTITTVTEMDSRAMGKMILIAWQMQAASSP